MLKQIASKKFSIGFVTLAILLAFVAGNRLQFVGDWFFAPYTNPNNTNLARTLNHDEIKEIYDLLKKRFDGDLDMADLQAGLARGLVDATGDPHTAYLTAEEAAELQDDLNGTFSGIGAELGRRNGSVVVVSPLNGSPAQKAGIRAGDVISEIDGEDASQLSLDEVVSKIRGEEGTRVKLGLLRDQKPVILTITRANISVPSVESEILAGNVGYLQISRFGNDTAELAREAAIEFKDRNVRKIIVDVRNNGGGLLDSPVQIAGLWLDSKVVAEQKSGGRITSELRSGSNPILEGTEVIVLINEGSASASEILAGALHDHGVARLLGETSFGKGSVQEIIDLRSGAQLKLTTARWFTPKGKNIDKDGIKPNIAVELTEEDFEQDRDPQKDRALRELR